MYKLFIAALYFFPFCTPLFARKNINYQTIDYVQTLKKVTDIMVNDVTSPVAASRYYAYITLASNEVIAVFKRPKQPSFAQKLPGFEGINAAQLPVAGSNASLATLLMVLKMGEKLLPSGYLLKAQSDSLLLSAASRGFSKNQIEHSVALVEGMAAQMMPYIRTDGFTRLSGKPRYTPRSAAGYWQPTPPVFMPPIEPFWGSLRTFLLDSARQFRPPTPAAYDTSRSSDFYRQMLETYQIGNNADAQQQSIAQFWDCNPFAIQQIGHIQYGLKKISPGGHWIGIAGIACQQKNWKLPNTVYAHTLLAITLADAFIACWEEKYHSNRIRPETAIHDLLNPRWHPLLQTPPFPEYVSGHSVASTAASVLLTHLFGDNFAFVDTTELEFDLPARSFTSFQQAAQEASISRLYGGIHFRDGIEQGVWLGQMVGEWVLIKLNP